MRLLSRRAGYYAWDAQTFALIAAVCLGIRSNGDSKHVRVLAPPGCASGWFNTETLDEGPPKARVVGCGCDGVAWHDEPDVCKAAAGVTGFGISSTTVMAALPWAPLLPCVPWALRAVDAVYVRGGGCEVRADVYQRGAVHAFILLIRTALLYKALGFVQAEMQAPETALCEYAKLRRSGLCRERFDFADHVVLYATHWVVLPCYELVAAALAPPWPAPRAGAAFFRAAASAALAFAADALTVWYVVNGLVGVYDTVTFFHTQAESLVAAALVFAFVHWPLRGRIWETNIWDDDWHDDDYDPDDADDWDENGWNENRAEPFPGTPIIFFLLLAALVYHNDVGFEWLSSEVSSYPEHDERHADTRVWEDAPDDTGGDGSGKWSQTW